MVLTFSLSFHWGTNLGQGLLHRRLVGPGFLNRAITHTLFMTFAKNANCVTFFCLFESEFYGRFSVGNRHHFALVGGRHALFHLTQNHLNIFGSRILGREYG